MRKIEIEQYKGQTIEYDIEHDKFVCEITSEDKTKNAKRGSLKDLRKDIDGFVKLNLEFKKFKLFKKRSYSNDFEVMYVDGIRTDGKFTCRNERHGTISGGYDLIDFEKELKGGDEFYIYDFDVIEEKKAIEKEETEYREIITKKEKALLKKLKKFDVEDVKKYVEAFAKS